MQASTFPSLSTISHAPSRHLLITTPPSPPLRTPKTTRPFANSVHEQPPNQLYGCPLLLSLLVFRIDNRDPDTESTLARDMMIEQEESAVPGQASDSLWIGMFRQLLMLRPEQNRAEGGRRFQLSCRRLYVSHPSYITALQYTKPLHQVADTCLDPQAEISVSSPPNVKVCFRNTNRKQARG